MLHAAGKEAYDPVMKKMLAAPKTITGAIGSAEHATDMQHFFMYVPVVTRVVDTSIVTFSRGINIFQLTEGKLLWIGIHKSL